MSKKKFTIVLKGEDVRFKPRHKLKASKKHKSIKDYTRKSKHKKPEF
jgi:hypothetical protein